MARQREKIYKRRRPLRTLLYSLGITVLMLAVLFVAVFFGFQRYIVYTPEGVRLDIPFLRDILDEIPEYAQAEPFLPQEPEPEPDLPDPEREEVMPREPIHTVLISGDTLAAVPDWASALRGVEANAMLVAVNDEMGRLWWESDVELAIQYDLIGEGLMEARLRSAGEDALCSALLFGFRNQLMAQRNPPASIVEGWLDPEHEEMRAYIIDLSLELAAQGFREIVLADFSWPPDLPQYRLPEHYDSVILSFLTELSLALGAKGAELSLMTQEAHWYNPDGETLPLYPDLAALSRLVARFYCVLAPETMEDPARFAALLSAAEAILGEAKRYRFVPGGVYGQAPDRGSWFAPASLSDLL